MASNNANRITHTTWNCKQLKFLSIAIKVNQALGYIKLKGAFHNEWIGWKSACFRSVWHCMPEGRIASPAGS